MGRLERSWKLVKASWEVLRSDKELIVFPIVAMAATIFVTATFVVPMILTGLLESVFTSHAGLRPLGLVLAFAFYLCQYTVIFYCNSALVGAALIRLRGGNPTLQDGFRIANERFGAIVGYALLSATVGLILRRLSEMAPGPFGKIAVALFGFAWNIATFLAVPVLVVEGVGPIEAVKRSTRLLKKTWGEQIIGNLSIGAVFAVVAVVGVAICGGAITLAAMTKSVFLIFAAIGFSVLLAIALGLIGSALSGIYTAAVYRYAAEGDAGSAFDPELVRNAFRPR